MAFTQVTLTGKVLLGDATPGGGASITLTLSTPISDGTQVVEPKALTAHCGADGSFSITVDANDDATTLPTGSYYEVQVGYADQTVMTFNVVVPHADAPTVPLFSLATLTNPNPLGAYVAQIVAGAGVTITPNGGTGQVTISATGSGGGSEGVTTVSAAAAAQTLTAPSGGKITYDLTGSAASCALSLASNASAGEVAVITAVLRQGSGGNNAWTFPANVHWPNGQLPPFSSVAGREDIVTFLSTNGGTTWLAALGSQNAQAIQVPAAPVLTVTPGTTDNALSWTVPNPGGAPISGYVINRSTTSGSETQLTTVASSVTSYTDSAVTPGTTYYYEVQAVNAGGNSVDSNEGSGTPTGSSPPSQPTITVTAGTGENTISFSAPANNGSPILYYWLQRSTTTGTETDYQQLSAAATSYVDTEVANPTTYFYKLIAVNANGSSPASAEQSGAPAAGSAATNWIDSGQNDYTITVQGSPTLPSKVAGDYGNAVSFPSDTTQAGLLLPPSIGFGGGGGSPFTVECRFMRSSTQSIEQGLCAKWNPSGSQNMYLYINASNELSCASHDNTTHVIGPLQGSTAITDTTTWHHGAMVYDGTTFYVFLDGTLQASQAGHGAGTLQAADTTTNVVIGAQSTTTKPFIGLIDEVRISNVARYTAAFTPASTPFVPDANTIALLHMD